MYHVDDIFKGFRAGWNRDYRAAQMIFSGTPDALAIRAAVQAQHHWLYNNIPSPETGAISGGEQLLQLFGFGKRRGKTRCEALLDNGLGGWLGGATRLLQPHLTTGLGTGGRRVRASLG